MTHLIRFALGAALLATVSACDSAPGALDPPAPGPATLRVRNAGSRTITSVDVVRCSSNPNGDIRWVPVSIPPNQTWTRQYAEGCHTVEIDFNTGGGWATTLNFSATTPTQINPF
jgi:hypothetical protein